MRFFAFMTANIFGKLNPYQIIILFFLGFITIGGVLLMSPLASQNGQILPWIDAMFTSVSATAVTGLIVVNTANYFSLFGQLVIITLIQIGGLGIMTMGTLLMLAVGRKLRLKELFVLQEELNVLSLSDILKFIKLIALVTFAVEGIGGLLLGIHWFPDMGWQGFYFGLWHAISAFCNAGFDLFGNSLMDFSGDTFVNFVISILIILGGIGFIPIYEIGKYKKWRKLSLHSKVVLIVTLILVIGGTLIIYFSESFNLRTISDLPINQQILTSYFQSVTTRTAGFNTINISQMFSSTIFILVILMFIGASPGSVGGGIKTTTAAVLFLTMNSLIRGNKEVSIYRKRVAQGAISRAIMLLLISSYMIIIAIIILLYTDPADLLVILFEVVSAFSTVGLSLGYTQYLSIVGKIVIMLMMFIGRVGPITLMLAIFNKKINKNIQYPKASIIVG